MLEEFREARERRPPIRSEQVGNAVVDSEPIPGSVGSIGMHERQWCSRTNVNGSREARRLQLVGPGRRGLRDALRLVHRPMVDRKGCRPKRRMRRIDDEETVLGEQRVDQRAECAGPGGTYDIGARQPGQRLGSVGKRSERGIEFGERRSDVVRSDGACPDRASVGIAMWHGDDVAFSVRPDDGAGRDLVEIVIFGLQPEHGNTGLAGFGLDYARIRNGSGCFVQGVQGPPEQTRLLTRDHTGRADGGEPIEARALCIGSYRHRIEHRGIHRAPRTLHRGSPILRTTEAVGEKAKRALVSPEPCSRHRFRAHWSAECCREPLVVGHESSSIPHVGANTLPPASSAAPLSPRYTARLEAP